MHINPFIGKEVKPDPEFQPIEKLILNPEFVNILREIEPKSISRIQMIIALKRIRKEIMCISMECHPGKEYGRYLDSLDTQLNRDCQKLFNNEEITFPTNFVR